MSLSQFCSSNLVTILPDATLQEAAEAMNEHSVGCLIVVDTSMSPIGMLTDRDIVVRAVAPGLSMKDEKVSKHMSASLATVSHLENLNHAIQKMRDHRVRRLLILDDGGKLCGLISSDEIVRLAAHELGALSALYYSQNGTTQRHKVHDYTRMA